MAFKYAPLFVLILFISLNLGHGLSPRDALVVVNPHILDGEEVSSDDSIPYQVEIQKWLEYLCGGVIVSKNHILSTATCFDFRTWIFAYGVRVGSANRESGTYKFVQSIVCHEKYHMSSYDYNIAVLTTLYPLTLSEQVQPIPIVEEGKRTAFSTQLIVSGWGQTSLDNRALSRRLRSAVILVLPHGRCKTKITERMLCAGPRSDSKGHAYFKDDGGPLVNLENKTELVGIISHGTLSVTSSMVFTKIADPEIWQFINQHVVLK